jgi:Flp pilus assembly protein TadG
MRNNARERGSVLILVVLALGLFLIAAIGFGIDGSHLYAERRMAQAAADAAAQAAMMSIFNGTNATSPYPFATEDPPVPVTCGTTDGRAPCLYAAMNKFGTSTADTVYIDFPSSVPGIGALSSDRVNLVRATVSRQVDTTLIRLLGPTATTIRAVAVAAILQTQSPTPIIVTHPTLPESLKVQGTPTITICGGPDRSIQVNSSSGTPQNPGLPAYAPGGNAYIDLSHAGTLDTAGDCTAGTGADFAVFGGPTAPVPQGNIVNSVNLGTAGDYLQPASPIADPLGDQRGDLTQRARLP